MNANYNRAGAYREAQEEKKKEKRRRLKTFGELRGEVQKVGDRAAGNNRLFLILLGAAIVCAIFAMFTSLKHGFWYHVWVILKWLLGIAAVVVGVFVFKDTIVGFWKYLVHFFTVEEEIPSEEEWKAKKKHRTHFFSEDGVEVQNESRMDEDW